MNYALAVPILIHVKHIHINAIGIETETPMSAYVHTDASPDRAGRPGWSFAAHRPGWFSRAEAWLDARGRGAWIAAMVLSFIVFWPLGLGLLAYMIWSKRMFGSCSHRGHRGHRHEFHARQMGGLTGNAAFDAYKADTLARLEREQSEFEDFLGRLRESRDKAEFDQYLNERARAAAEPTEAPDPQPTPQDEGKGRY